MPPQASLLSPRLVLIYLTTCFLMDVPDSCYSQEIARSPVHLIASVWRVGRSIELTSRISRVPNVLADPWSRKGG